ncbi:F-box domain-containing protein [Pseudomonas wadenswilerensis]
MLNAVLSGKRTGSGIEGLRLELGEAKGAEDVITASVFERLAYLPDELFSAVFSTLLGEPFDALDRMDFWPNWKGRDGLVQPDVVLTDGTTTVLVEAKRYDTFRQQDPVQLARELEAGWERGEIPDNTLLVTLGGMERHDELTRQALLAQIEAKLHSGHPAYRLVCLSWRHLFEVARQVITPAKSPALDRLLADIASAYAWHGLHTHAPRWLDQLTVKNLDIADGCFDHWRLK